MQKPLELILARNLMSSLSTPAFLTDEAGVLIFYNEAAGKLLGKRFEEIGGLGADVWSQIGPFDSEGKRIPVDQLPLTRALRDGSPAHDTLRIRNFHGVEHDIHVSALPIVTVAGSKGSMAFFWPDEQGPGSTGGPG